jgi:hypothetical protein
VEDTDWIDLGVTVNEEVMFQNNVTDTTVKVEGPPEDQAGAGGALCPGSAS